MSDMTLNAALDRIQLTRESEPVSVFASLEPGMVNVVFHNTIVTRQWIEAGEPRYLGTFHGNSPRAEVKQALRKGMRGA